MDVSTRLPIDGSVLAYFGFDEANPDDVAVDEAHEAGNLIVQSSTGVIPARLGNGRQFDGVNTYAQAIDSSQFRRDFNTIIVWIILDSVNQVGDLLRPILTLEGPNADAESDTAHGLYVDSTGALVYRYTDHLRQDCVRRTAAGTIRVNRYYSIAITRDQANGPPTGDGLFHIDLWLNNEPTNWTSFTVAGVAQPDPTAGGEYPQQSGLDTLFMVGRSLKTGSRWHGVIDELSLHGVARPKQPYLDAAFYRLTLSTTFSRLTTKGTVKVLASAEMGGGTRWWCYLRDQSLYVIRENSLGLFSSEVQLTQGGNLANGAPSPGGVETPRLAYDASSDTLVVAFLGAGRVFKVTATSADLPAPQIMPYTQDTTTVLKATDARDIMRASAGEQLRPEGTLSGVLQYVASPAGISFIATPSFGVAVSGTHPYGYAVYQKAGNQSVLIGYARGATVGGGYWFIPVATRIWGATYYAAPLVGAGTAAYAQPLSWFLVDWYGEIVVNARIPTYWTPDVLTYNVYGEVTNALYDPSGGEPTLRNEAWTMVTQIPVKQLLSEPSMLQSAGEGQFRPMWSMVTQIPVKQLIYDSFATTGGGESGRATATLNNYLVDV